MREGEFDYYPGLKPVAGSTEAALILSLVLHWHKQGTITDPDGWFSKTDEEWKAETFMSPEELQTALTDLSRCAIWEKEERGTPALPYYRINDDALIAEVKAKKASKKGSEGAR